MASSVEQQNKRQLRQKVLAERQARPDADIAQEYGQGPEMQGISQGGTSLTGGGWENQDKFAKQQQQAQAQQQQAEQAKDEQGSRASGAAKIAAGRAAQVGSRAAEP